jgi:pyruvate formate lyase activating enzyme
MPDKVVEGALHANCKSIAYTYSEPTAFYEYMLDTSKLARREEIKNVWITNGYINEGALKELCNFLDAANVDLKSFKEEIYNNLNSGTLQPVLDTLKTLKEQNVWFEITNLIVPTWTDKIEMIEEMCKWLVKNVGPDYPLHFSRFHPYYKLTNLPQTPIKILEEARRVALEAGLKFVYIGNVPGHPAQSTYCPACDKILIERKGYYVAQNNLVGGSCKFCGEEIAGVWV